MAPIRWWSGVVPARARPDVRARRDEPAERHEGGDLPDGLELAAMRADIREAYRTNPLVLGIFPVAAYNGGPKKCREALPRADRMDVQLDELSRPNAQLTDSSVKCPCVWKADGDGGPSGGDPEIQQREPLVHREVPEHRQPVRVTAHQ